MNSLVCNSPYNLVADWIDVDERGKMIVRVSVFNRFHPEFYNDLSGREIYVGKPSRLPGCFVRYGGKTCYATINDPPSVFIHESEG